MSNKTMISFIEHIMQPKNKMIAFVGAGISRESPASVPLSREIIDIILNKVIEEIDLSPILVENLNKSLKETALPLEYFSQIAVQIFGKEFVHLFPNLIQNQSHPNNFHRFIAIAASRGLFEAIFTPNFDEFIEESMRSIGMVDSETSTLSLNPPDLNKFPVRYYRVISSYDNLISLERFNDLITTHQPADTIPIFKLHGTLSKPESILISIESYQSWFLMNQRRFVVDFSCQKPRIWFFAGYSGRDEIFRWLHPPVYGVGQKSPVFQKIYWLTKDESSILAPEVDVFLKKHSAAIIVGTAEELAHNVLINLDEAIQTDSLSFRTSEFEHLSEWFMQKPRMKLYNFAAALCLFLGRFSDAIEIIRTGIHVADNPDFREIPSIIGGLLYTSIAKAELGNPEGAASDIEQGINDWRTYKTEIIANGVNEGDWKYFENHMKLWQGFTLHLRNHSITDQIAAWRLMEEAGEAFENWHDNQGLPRNFESSREYAELQWRKGIYLLKGGDLEFSRRCFWRLIDVDVFNELLMMRTRHLFGLAMVHEAEAIKAECYPYGNLIVQDHLKAALDIGEGALASIKTTYQVDILGDILMLLARVTEKLGKKEDAITYYNRAANHFRYVCGDYLKENNIMKKIEELNA